MVDCAIMEPSPFLREGVIFMEDEPPVDAPQVMIDEPHMLDDKLQVFCILYTPSFKRSLKRRRTQVESKSATRISLCFRRMLKKYGLLEMWTVHSERFQAST